MTGWRLVLRSLTHHWRIHIAVAMGVAAATTVLTGALLVGDSVRGSLRSLALDRLGAIDEVLVTDRFFREKLANELASSSGFSDSFDRAAPAILFPQATVERKSEDASTRAGNVLVVGCDGRFWEFDEASIRPERFPGKNEIVINQAVADDLGAGVGDRLALRLPKSSQVPADSPLANKSDRIQSLVGLEVIEVLPTEGLARFSLRASQSLPKNVFVSMAMLQDALEQEGKSNAIFVSLQPTIDPVSDKAVAASDALQSALRPSFEDFGLMIKHVTQEFEGSDANKEKIFDYFSVTSDRLILSPTAAEILAEAFASAGGQPVFTYLANSIDKVDPPGDRPGVPYSMVSAIDFTDDFPLSDVDDQKIRPLNEDEIVLNSWTAQDLGAKPGDKIRLTFFEPETTHGNTAEQSAEFTLKAITPLVEPSRPYRFKRPAVYDQPPGLANDPDLTPEVEGVTDSESIDAWDPPFPFEYERINLRRPRDDNYWKNYRTTPKSFIALGKGEQIWRSRFGNSTSFRIPATSDVSEESIKATFITQLANRQETLGFDFRPVKRLQLKASSGTTPFDGLFLGLSMFIIAAALMLVALLFRLGVEQRADEVGILLAVGLRRRRAGGLLVLEGAMVSAVGAAVGVVLGIGYAWLMLAGLRTWWLGAITTPFLQFHYTPFSLALGYALGVVVSVATIAWSIRQTRHISVRRLLAGQASDSGSYTYRQPRLLTWFAVVLIVLALALLIVATQLGGMPQAGAFVGGGAALLTGLLILIWARLRRGGRGRASTLAGEMALLKLAMRNAARNPSRSATTIGLIATASFLIVAMSSFRLDPTSAGAGGFDLVAESSGAIFADLNTKMGRQQLLDKSAEVLDGGAAFGLRLKPGDDASCNNLYQSTQPRVIGMTPDFVNYFDDPEVQSFSWASRLSDESNPWRLLETAETEDGAVPMVVDMNTAMYSLKLPPGAGSIYTATYDDGAPIRFQVVGMLENSVLQGSLMVAEEQFERLFPETDGYRYFMIRSPSGRSAEVAEVLEDRLGDQGFDAVPSSLVLEQLLAVQNTYLSTFQTLGALGLLLGTFGLATVQLRNVVERRGELALMRAAGFKRRTLGRMVLIENTALLLGGLATGVFAAALAVLPHKLVGDAAITGDLLRDLGLMLAIVLVVGMISSMAAVRAALRTPMLAALRGD